MVAACRTLLLGAALALGVCLPQTAQAGPTLAASLGVGGQVSPEAYYQATNLLLAGGYDFAGFLRPELGLVGTLEQIRGGNVLNVGWEARPMLVVSAPLVPVYLRLVFAVVDPFSQENRAWAYGGAVGMGLSLVGLGIFAELGLLPRSSVGQIAWVMEGRAGVTLGF